jgi:hypothetical protein
MGDRYSIQRHLEQHVVNILGALPVWLRHDCRAALQAYMCGSFFLTPKQVNMTVYQLPAQWSNFTFIVPHDYDFDPTTSSTASTSSSSSEDFLSTFLSMAWPVASYEAYLPSYPQRDLCTTYADTCKSFLSEFGDAYPHLQPNCDAEVRGVALFPDGNQTVFSLSQTIPVSVDTINNINREGGNDEEGVIRNNITVAMALSTSPSFKALDRLSPLQEWILSRDSVKCPSSFVATEDLTDPSIKWIQGTGCAQYCR